MEEQGTDPAAAMRAWLREEFFASSFLAGDMTKVAAMRIQASMRADWCAEALFELEGFVDHSAYPMRKAHHDGLRREFMEREGQL